MGQDQVYDLFQGKKTTSVLLSRVFSIHYLPVKTVAAWLQQGKTPLLGKQGRLSFNVQTEYALGA